MSLKLSHQNLDIYQVSKKFAVHCYQLTKHLPIDEKFGMISQIRRAALSVHLNIAEGCSRKSLTERKRYFEMARGSVVEIDAALDIAEKLIISRIMTLQNWEIIWLGAFKCYPN